MALLSALPALRAQSYDTPDEGRYHESSIYYITLQDASGRNINSDFAHIPNVIGAFVGGDLRGVSRQMTVDPTTGQTVLAVRVWGDEHDPATVDFRLRYASLEYLLATHAFAPGQDVNYGSPSHPLVFKFTPVTTLTLSPSIVSVLVDATVVVEPQLTPATHTPLVTPMTYDFSAGEYTSIFTVDADGRVRGMASGKGILNVQAKDGDHVVFSASATVSVVNTAIHVTGIRNDMPSLEVSKDVGEDFRLLFTLLPENATNRNVSYRIGSYDVLTYTLDDRGVATFKGLKAGKSTVTVVSDDNPDISLTYNVTINGKEEAASLTYPDELTLSKLHDVTLTLVPSPEGATIDSKLVTITIAQSDNPGWGDVATVAMADDTGCTWNVRGRYVGDYTYSVSYDGRSMLTDKGRTQGTLHIPAEYVFTDGWQWISFYAVPSTGSIVLKQDGEWTGALYEGTQSRVMQLRSQQDYLNYDPTLGYFGTLTALDPTAGCIKTYTRCESKDEGKMVINLGSTGLKMATELSLPQAQEGYTWVTYPHELDHRFDVLADYLDINASDGDMLIGRDGFAEYIDDEWQANDDFTIHAGQGYIYYTGDARAKAINWGPATLAPDPAASRIYPVPAPVAVQPVPATSHSETMPVVVRVEALELGEGQSVAAFVADECRALGATTPDGLLHLAVTGQAGEEVSLEFVDADKGTRTPSGVTVPFALRAGSHRSPVVLTLSGSPRTGEVLPSDTGLYDLQGRRISSAPRKGIYIQNGKKVVK